jgi:hypothetical protein
MAELRQPHPADAHGDDPRVLVDRPGVRHETSDVDIRAVLAFGAALLVAAVLIHGLVALLFWYFVGREARRQTIQYPLAITQRERLPPEPRLQVNPRQDMRDLRAHEDEILTTYGWVDKSAGIVRIPIDQAMKLTIERGLPARRPIQVADGVNTASSVKR